MLPTLEHTSRKKDHSLSANIEFYSKLLVAVPMGTVIPELTCLITMDKSVRDMCGGQTIVPVAIAMVSMVTFYV